MTTSKWLPIFLSFVQDLRISSKEVTTSDERGVKLELWESQRRFLQEIAFGLDADIRDFTNLKSRQLGITTISLAIDVFWLAMHPNLTGALVSDTDKNRGKNRAQIERYTRSLPENYFGTSFDILQSNDKFTQFSNGSRLDYLVAGTKKKSTAWGEGEGYAYVHETEVAAYGDALGLDSFEESFAQTNPSRLFIRESTAKGFNHFREMYNAAKADGMTKRAFFIGWWACDMNRIERHDPRFVAFGRYAPTREEREKIGLVEQLYQWKITPEQLAWIRWREADPKNDSNLLDQNQPWIESQAFIETGFSFFQTRAIAKDMQELEASDVGYTAYRYNLGTDFFGMTMDQVDDDDQRGEIELKIWEEPVPEGKYLIGADPAYGRNEHKDHHCFGSDTEILMKSGWKRYTEIEIDDQAVCFDLKSGSYSYGAISDKIVMDYSGDMYHFTSRGLDCLVTPEHRVVTRCYRVLRDGRKSPWNFRTAREIAESGRSVREIPTGGAPIGNGIKGLSVNTCRAIGWILTDGSFKINRRASIQVSQALLTVKGGIHVYDEMRRVFKSLCPNAHTTVVPAKGTSTPAWYCLIGVDESEQFMVWLEKAAKKEDRRIPRRLIEQSSQEQLEALFQGILEGDGSWQDDYGWVKVSPGLCYGLASDIQEIACRLGYSPSIACQKAAMTRGKMGRDQWIVNLSTRAAHTFEATNVAVVPYSGKVWCVVVPTGSFVARRNGKMFVTGNCASVWRGFADKIVQVAEFVTADIEVKHFAWIMAHLAGAYRDCIINLEIGGPGRMIMLEWEHIRSMLKAEMYFQRVRGSKWEDAMDNARWYLYHRPDSMGPGFAANFETTWRTKHELMHQFRGAYATRELEIRSMYLYHEMSLVVQNGNEIGAPESRSESCKDDRVFAAALANRAWINWIRPAMINDGLSYQKVMEKEKGESPSLSTRMNDQVYRFFKSQQEAAEEAELNPPKTWRSERGLLG